MKSARELGHELANWDGYRRCPPRGHGPTCDHATWMFAMATLGMAQQERAANDRRSREVAAIFADDGGQP